MIQDNRKKKQVTTNKLQLVLGIGVYKDVMINRNKILMLRLFDFKNILSYQSWTGYTGTTVQTFKNILDLATKCILFKLIMNNGFLLLLIISLLFHLRNIFYCKIFF